MNSSAEPVLNIRHSNISDAERIHAVVRDAFSREEEAALVAAVRQAGEHRAMCVPGR